MPWWNTIEVKTSEQIEIMTRCGELQSKAMGVIAQYVKEGINTLRLNSIAEEFINDCGGSPAFKGYHNYPYAICTSVNEVVAHGIPSEYCLKDGDIISVDCGVLYEGFYSDQTFTFMIGNVDSQTKRLVDTTLNALYCGISHCIIGNRIGDISNAIQTCCDLNGFSIVQEMFGHGIGKNLHQKPKIPNFGRSNRGCKLCNGNVLAIEPMINMGVRYVYKSPDGWSIKTEDGLPSAHFENTVAITENGPLLLTHYRYVEEELKTN